MNKILTFKDGVEFVGEVFSKYDYTSYTPRSRNDLNTDNAYTIIDIPAQNELFHTSNSYISITGKVICPDVALTAAEYAKIRFRVLNLFKDIKYFICDKEVEKVDQPGYTVFVKKLLLSKNISNIADEKTLNDSGYFSVAIPLKHIFSIFELYNKAIIHVSQRIDILRTTNHNNCFYIDDAALITKLAEKELNVELSDIVWEIPHVQPLLEQITKINKILENKKYLTNYYKFWKHETRLFPETNSKEYTWDVTTLPNRPSYIIFCFQTGRANNITKDNLVFDLCDLENVTVRLNSDEYPKQALNMNKTTNEYNRAYNLYNNFKMSYYRNEKIDISIHPNIISKTNFLTKYPIFIIDTSFREETVKDISINLKLQFKFKNRIPQNTRVHCFIVSDYIFAYSPGLNLIKVNSK